MSTHADHDDHGELGHIVPFSTYRNVLIGLLILTVLTVVVAKYEAFDFGEWNIALAMIIASVKATIVAMYFMHLKFEDAVTWLYAGFPVVLLILMMAGIFIDNPLRDHDAPVQIVDPLGITKNVELVGGGTASHGENSHKNADDAHHNSAGDSAHH